MSNCTDCIPQVQDPCGGKKTPTDCIISLGSIESLGINPNEELRISLIKIGNLFQTIFSSIEGYDPNEVQTLKSINGTITWQTD